MKKVISVLLLLAMVLGCFAGCAPEAQEDAALNAAAEYIYAMYKDAKSTTDADFTVVAQVRIDDVVYPITWTADKAENVQVVAGENGMATVKITAGAEEISYKLTATVKNEQGQEASVSFDFVIPAKAQVAGKTIVLAYPKENKFITGSHYLYTGKNKWQLNLTENEAEGIALEVIENSDGTVTFKAGDQYLFCDATHVKFVSTQDDNTKFVLEAADTDGGYYIKCAVANYNGSPQYLEVYSGYLTCYGMGSDPSIYVFKLQETTTAAGTISGLDENSGNTGNNNTGDSGNSGNTGNTGNNNTGSTGGDKVDTDKTSATIYYAGEKLYVTGTEYSYTSSTSGKTKIELTLSSKKADAIALTIKTNSDKTVSFVNGKNYLYCDGTDVKFVTKQSDSTKFVLESAGAEGKYFIKCATANYNGNAQYLEVYKGYLTCYSLYADSDTSIFTFELKDTSGAKGKVVNVGSSSGGNTSGGNTSGGNTSGGNTSGGNTSGGNTSGGNTSGGNTGNTSDYTQVSSLKTGDKVVIVNPASNMALSMNKVATYYNEGISVAGGFGNITKTEIFTVTKNSDGTYSFTSLSGKVLALADEYSSLNDTGANTKWELSSAGNNQFYLKNVARGNYLEWYASKNNWSTYSTDNLTDEFVLTFYVTTGNGSTSGGSSSGGNTSGGNSGSSDNTGSGNVDVNGKKAASIDLTGTTTRTNYTKSQIVHSANGITYTNDKGTSTNNFYDMTGKTYATRAYKGSTVKIEYKNMVAIVLHLDDYVQTDGTTYVGGFDDMVVAGATITRDGATVVITFASATNVFQSGNMASQTRIKSIDVYTAN